MTRWTERGAVLSLAPLALTLIALAVRQAKYVPPRPTGAHESSGDFVVPEPFLAAARAPGVEQRYTVDASVSRVLLQAADSRAASTSSAPIGGSLRILADGSWADLELATPSDATLALVIQSAGAPSRASEVPGAFVSSIGADIEGRAGPIDLVTTWMRLPFGVVRAQSVAEIGGEHPATLALDLTLRADR